MPYNKYDLPKYPVSADMWDILAAEDRPIVVYGMGNGADKLFSRFEKYGIRAADVFASDGFVRGHSYRGVRVKSFSEIKEAYSDFVIVISFASSRPEVIDMLSAINNQYDVYIPDMPVADAEIYFDREFYNRNYEKIVRAYELLGDEISKNCYAAILNYKLTGRMEYLLGAYSDTDDIYSLIGCDNVKCALDVGAYNGDTVREMKRYFGKLEKIVAIEPDKRNFKKLMKYSEECDLPRPEIINAAAHSECGVASFSSSGNRNSSIASSASYEHRVDVVPLITVDSLELSPDYIKYDVEGAEYEALLGSHNTIKKCSPVLLASLYHKSRDIFELPLLIDERYHGRSMFLRRTKCLPAWEIDLIVK